MSTKPLNAQTRGLLWALVLVYAAARVTQAYPDKIPMIAIIAFHVVPTLLFAFVHGAVRYGIRGILIFMCLCVVIGNMTENLSILTGFPFGHYHFTEVMGPKILQVPILLGLAYIGMGYLSWTLGLVIVGETGEDGRRPLAGQRVWSAPLFAAFVMVAWDLSMDPIWSNFVHAWIWHDGGSYFGVPVSNFLGWYLTVYLIYQSFALHLRKVLPGKQPTTAPLPLGYWQLAVILYAVSAAGNLLVARPFGLQTVTDGAGTAWSVTGVLSASARVSIFVMAPFALIAWVRLTYGGKSRRP